MITTEHMGYKITYSENEDVWNCGMLQFSAPTLSALKRKISKHDADLRRLPYLPVLHSSYGGDDWKAGWVATVLDADQDKVWIARAPEVSTKSHGREREKVGLSYVILDTPENRKACAEHMKLVEERRRIDALCRESVKRLPFATREQLMSLRQTEDA